MLLSVTGGVLIGVGASVLLLFNGRVAGISGIFWSSLLPSTGDRGWRLSFVLGMLLTGGLLAALRPGSVGVAPAPSWLLAASGLVVGFGTRLGSGCTGGHGGWGLSRLSVRSLVATCLFMAGGAGALLVAYALTGPLGASPS